MRGMRDVRSITFTTNGQVLALKISNLGRMAVRTWDTHTGEIMRTIGNPNPFWEPPPSRSVTAISPDGKVIAVALKSRRVQLFEVGSGKQLHSLEGHFSSVTALAFSADGQTLASGSVDGTIRLWNVDSGTQVNKLRDYHMLSTIVFLPPDGRTLASVTCTSTIRLWNTCNGEQIQLLKADDLSGVALSFSADGQITALMSTAGIVQLWSNLTGKRIFRIGLCACMELAGSESGFKSLPSSLMSFSPNEHVISVAMSDHTIQLWNTQTGEIVFKMEGHTDEIVGVSFSSDGSMVASTSVDGTLRIWNSATGEEKQKIAHLELVGGPFFFSDGKSVATMSTEGLDTWNALTGEHIRLVECPSRTVRSTSFRPDGLVAATALSDQTATADDGIITRQSTEDDDDDGSFHEEFKTDCEHLQVFDIRTGKRSIQFLSLQDGRPRAGALSSDGQSAAIGLDDGTIELWNTHTGDRTHKLGERHRALDKLVFSPNGQALVSASGDGTAWLWNTCTGEQTLKWKVHHEDEDSLSGGRKCEGQAPAINLSTDDHLVTMCADRIVQLWNVHNGEQTVRIKLPGYYYLSDLVTALSPHNEILAVAYDRIVHSWNLQTGQQMQSFKGHNASVIAMTFSPDGQLLASTSTDFTTRLWNIRTDREIHNVEGSIGDVTTVGFSPDGKVVVSGSLDGQLLLWNVSTGKEIKKLQGHTSCINATTFSPDGKILASASNGQTVQLWNVESGEQAHVLETANPVSDTCLQDDDFNDNSSAYSWHPFIPLIAFSASGQVMATATPSKTPVCLWDTATGRRIQALQGTMSRVIKLLVFSPSGKFVACGSSTKHGRASRELGLWNSQTGQQTQNFDLSIPYRGECTAVCFSTDELVLVSAGEEGLCIWEITSNELVQTLEWPNREVLESPNKKIFETPDWFVTAERYLAIKFSRDGKYVYRSDRTFLFDWGPPASLSGPLERTDGLTLQESWIQYRGQDLLYLPYDFRGTCSARHENVLVIGQRSGAVDFFRLSSLPSRL